MRFYVSRSGVLAPKWLFALVASFVAMVLTVTMLPADASAEEVPTAEVTDPLPKGSDSDGDGDLDRPDSVSAAVTARALDRRVEDLSKRTESTRTFVNSDGSLTDEQFGGAVRVQDEDGSWDDVDYDLVVQADGSFRPKVSPVDVTISGGGAKEAARVSFEGDESMAVTWPDVLPTPTVEGGVATYKVSDSADLLVSVTSAGVSTRIRLNEAPSEADPEYVLGLRTDSVDVSESAAGLKVVDDDGATIARTSALVAWDAKTDDAGEPAEVVQLETSLDETSTSGDVTRHDLTLTPPEGYLQDPETVYPVIIDPDIATMNRVRDTWVRDGSAATGGSPTLLVGRQGGASNTNPARAYLKFYSNLEGKNVLRAELGLYQYFSAVCGDRRMMVYPVTGTWEDTITWANRPGVVTGTSATTSVYTNRGASSSCAAGVTKVNVTNMAKAWGDETIDIQGVRLSAETETNSAWERRFCSMDADSSHSICKYASRLPYLSVTYNGPPNVAAVPSATASRTWDGTLYVGSTNPTWSTSATDQEASTVKYTTEARPSTGSSTVSATCTTALVASGATASCASTTALTSGSTYVARSRATDSHGEVGGWSGWRTFTVDTTIPSVPTVSCTDFADGQWYENPTASSTTCTITDAAGDDVDWELNGAAKSALTLSGGSASTPSITVPASGFTHIEVRSRTRAGTVSDWKSVSFGTGGATLTEPVQDDRSTSTFPVDAAAPPGADSAKIQWRFAPDTEGDTTTGWADATEVKKASDDTVWDGSVTGTDMSATPRLIWDPQDEPGIGAQGLVEVRVVFAYPGSVTKASPLQRVQVIPHAFGGSFPTEGFGPGEAALFTGEFQFAETDVDVPGFGESLTLGRSHLTLAGEPAGPAGVFGPGWRADLTGPEAGVAGFTVVDRTGIDGTFQLVAPEGDTYVYLHSTKTTGAQQVGTYNGVGETALEEDSLKLAAVTGETGITHRLTLTEWDGTKTIFVRTSTEVWTTEKVVAPEDNATTTYAHNTDGTVSWIFAPAPAGVACDTSDQEPGCRALQIVYDGSGAAKRLVEVKLRIWDPKPAADGKPSTGAGMETVSVAKYSYNGSGQLTAAWDPRVADGSAALKTEYEYTDTSPRPKISKVTEPGLKPWVFEYTSGGKISKVLRTHDTAVGSGNAQWTIKYDLALAGSGDGLPNMSADATKTWGQPAADAPVGGTAVFGPDQVPGSPISAAEYEYADLSYFTQSGRTTNAASFGADAWQIDSTRYDTNGNEIWALDAEGRKKALAEGSTTEETAGAADKYATLTVYNAAGTRVEETYDPMREMLLDDGTPMVARTITQTVYDDEADSGLMPGRPTVDVPADGYGLAVEERSSVTDRTSAGADGDLFDTKKTRYRYDPISTGDGDGWELKTPTRVLTEDGSGWATTLTRFDPEGKILETRTPQGTESTDGAGSDTRSTKTVYYTADTSASRSECRNKPAWAGETCWTGPAGQTGSGHPIPETTVTGFSINLAPTRTEETSGSVTRVNLSEYDAAGRSTKSAVTTSGLATADRTIAATTTTYSATTGAVSTVTNGTQTQTTGYDSWGRAISQTDGTGNSATTTYDTAGRVATANDGKGTYTYTYNGTDSAGKDERRGLVTALDVGLASGPDVFTGAYDASGDLIEQNYPGGITAEWTRDVTGDDIGLTYEQDGEPLLGYSAKVDADGRVREAVGVGSAQTYVYDDRDRLKKVTDTIADQCSTTTYGFSGDSNRTNHSIYGPGSGGACQDSTASSTVSSSFDAADRITTSGYVYDELGRTKTVPAAHTSNTGGGNLTVGYHADDMVATLSQSVVEDGATVVKAQDYTLDVEGQVSVTKNLTAGVSLTESTNHYNGGSDSPVWIETKTRPDASTAWATAWDRNVSSLAGDLGIIQTSDGAAKIQLANMHGDVAATIAVGDTGIDSYSEYTEYGLPRDVGNTPERYGWLGAKQRDASTVGGLTLMGARLYNPTTARFLSRDPVSGGNDNTYIYPADPINMFDLDGEWGMPKWAKKAAKKVGGHLKKHWKTYASVGSMFVPGLGAAGAAYRAYKTGKAARAAYKAHKAFKKAGGLRKLHGLRTGRITKGTARRISDGPAPKHWHKMGRSHQAQYKRHFHIERRVASYTRYNRHGYSTTYRFPQRRGRYER